MPEVDYRDCLDLAGEIAERIQPSDGSAPYEGDDLIGDCIIPAIKPTIAELLHLRNERDRLRISGDMVPVEALDLMTSQRDEVIAEREEAIAALKDMASLARELIAGEKQTNAGASRAGVAAMFQERINEVLAKLEKTP
jgi:hypothetical protein